MRKATTRLSEADVGRLLRLLAEQTLQNAIILIDDDGRVMWWNSAAEQVFGIAGDQAVGRPLAAAFTDDERAMGIPEHELAVARAGSAAQDDRWLVRRDGSRFWATGVTIALHDDEGRFAAYGKILRNRTDLKEQIESLRNTVSELDATNRRKDVFVGTLAHELRGPLAPLRNATSLIRMATRESVDLEQPLRIIERQVDALARLVDDLLDITRINVGKVDLQRRRVVLQQIVQAAIETCAPLVAERGQRLDVVLSPAPIIVDADPDRLRQVFANLITNAAKFTPQRGRIWVKANVESGEAVVDVEDDGAGIAPDMLPLIFDLFTQVESTLPHSRHGLGIGLALVKELVTLHGGSVQVRSDGTGRGSKFTVRLPLPKTSATR